ncbi:MULTISPECIES: carboxyl transferase domain-containing protein [unclassified Streptomyces]|uniref:carboxyl transferase domain-containing protein n=1 Tax=unclassified Streptomyces TaxID=2593676 RepID=UPI0022B68621|nr:MULTISPECIES: carboxyl transferase domain-containing protein [unclassified Streptomyces]MCZ7415653.1 acetyl-CoA carboxylase [Streptomyces sp. WMMC897]MCZ7434534.1 acetyl-CoA carboxylase [Streptomyces sp. WMMC1477]
MTRPGGPGSARAAIAAVADTFTEFPGEAGEAVRAPDDGPLGWEGYGEARARAMARTGERESVVCGVGRVGESEAALIAFEFGYLGGSLGGRTGDLLEEAHTRARDLSLPVVSLIATGGSRMQEGMRALSQLQRVARQSARTRAAGLAQVAVLRDPATGGGWATLGAGADVLLALPGAQIGFAGSRVRPPGADPRAYTAEGQLAAGHIDAVVPEPELRTALGRWLSLLTRPATGPAQPPAALGRAALPDSGWAAVQQARAEDRPRADAYLDAHFAVRAELSGDRCGGVDPGVRCGFGERSGRTVAFAAQLGTPTRPAGFRTVTRLLRLAGRLGTPVLTLVDTPGAANDAAAEREGAGAAIAECFAAVAESPVPVTTLVIGQGGSGGALALASPGRTWLTPDSYFSVIGPEWAASILKRGPGEVQRTANELRVRPQDLVALGIAEGIVGNPPPPGVA